MFLAFFTILTFKWSYLKFYQEFDIIQKTWRFLLNSRTNLYENFFECNHCKKSFSQKRFMRNFWQFLHLIGRISRIIRNFTLKKKLEVPLDHTIKNFWKIMFLEPFFEKVCMIGGSIPKNIKNNPYLSFYTDLSRTNVFLRKVLCRSNSLQVFTELQHVHKKL